MIKYISFDLDGTLADDTFDKLIWHEEIPKLYAEKHGLSISRAKTEVYSQYYAALDIERVGAKWTDISYWFRRFELSDWRTLVRDMRKHIFVYPDTIETLEYLSKKYRLLVVSNANKKFLNLKLEVEGLKKYFEYCFSAPTDFRISRKNRAMFEGILSKLKIKPAQIVHIGDDVHLDYEAPRSAGIKSYLLSRKAKKKSDGTIFSLLELKKKL